MVKNMEQIRQLYQDAMYWHLIHQGYSEKRAKMIANQLIKNINMPLHISKRFQ